MDDVDILERCIAALEHARQAGRSSLEAHRDAGAALAALKENRRGTFERTASEHCGCTPQWARRLMTLHREWERVVAAREWAEHWRKDLLPKLNSVDGALSVLQDYKTETLGEDKKGPRRKVSLTQRLKDENAQLRESLVAANDALAAANAQITVLEAELSNYQNGQAIGAKVDFRPALPAP